MYWNGTCSSQQAGSCVNFGIFWGHSETSNKMKLHLFWELNKVLLVPCPFICNFDTFVAKKSAIFFLKCNHNIALCKGALRPSLKPLLAAYKFCCGKFRQSLDMRVVWLVRAQLMVHDARVKHTCHIKIFTFGFQNFKSVCRNRKTRSLASCLLRFRNISLLFQ